MASGCSCSCVTTNAVNVSSSLSAARLFESSISSVAVPSVGTVRFQSLRRRNWRKSMRSSRGGAAGVLVVRAEGGADNVLRGQSLSYEGPGRGGQWLSATTRHVRLYVGDADPETKILDQSQLEKLTLMLDPDNEFVWPDEQVQKVYDYFTELVENYAGAACTEYTLRLIGSDIEHYIRKLLLANEIKYNLEASVLNFSMGLPRYDPSTLEGVEEEAG